MTDELYEDPDAGRIADEAVVVTTAGAASALFMHNGQPVFVAYGHGTVLIMRDGGGMVFDLEQTDRLIEKLQTAREAAGRNIPDG